MDFASLDFRRLRTYPLRERDNQVRLGQFARPWQPGGRFATLVESLPRLLVGATSEDVQRGLDGGVVLNLGSAVVLPEVFLKALTIARNLGHTVEDVTAVSFDMNRHYRPTENVLRRPVAKAGRGYYVVGHRERLSPLWAAAVLEQLSFRSRP